MNLTFDLTILDKLCGLSEEDMADYIPSNIFIARAVPTPSGKFHALFSAPGLRPEVSRHRNGDPYEFNTEAEAEARAAYALLEVLNKPRISARQSQGKKEIYRKLTGVEFAVLLAEAGLTPTFLAFLYGTSPDRVLKWIDSVEDVPHPVRLLLEIFKAKPETIDIAERITEANTTSRRPERKAE